MPVGRDGMKHWRQKNWFVNCKAQFRKLGGFGPPLAFDQGQGQGQKMGQWPHAEGSLGPC